MTLASVIIVGLMRMSSIVLVILIIYCFDKKLRLRKTLIFSSLMLLVSTTDPFNYYYGYSSFILRKMTTTPDFFSLSVILSGILLFLFSILNRKLEIGLFSINLISNNLVKLLNGHMPIYRPINGTILELTPGYEYINDQTALPYLGDWIILTKNVILSPGDIAFILSAVITMFQLSNMIRNIRYDRIFYRLG